MRLANIREALIDENQSVCGRVIISETLIVARKAGQILANIREALIDAKPMGYRVTFISKALIVAREAW